MTNILNTIEIFVDCRAKNIYDFIENAYTYFS